MELDRRNMLFPPAIVHEDESVVYRRQLRQAKERQAMRDAEADAYIDNAFWGQPYKSIFEEFPWLADGFGLIYDPETQTLQKK